MMIIGHVSNDNSVIAMPVGLLFQSIAYPLASNRPVTKILIDKPVQTRVITAATVNAMIDDADILRLIVSKCLLL